jgi:hypothetical protein
LKEKKELKVHPSPRPYESGVVADKVFSDFPPKGRKHTHFLTR